MCATRSKIDPRTVAGPPGPCARRDAPRFRQRCSAMRECPRTGRWGRVGPRSAR